MLLKELNDTTDVDTPDLAAKGDFIPLKVEVAKKSINKLVNDSIGLNNLKTKVENLYVDK